MTKVFDFVDPARGAVDAAGQGINDGDQVNEVGLSRKHIFDAVDASIARLGTYIDVLQTHRLDREVSLDETMKALNGIVESEKARHIGGSSMAAWEFQMAQNIAEKHNWHKETNIGLLPWSPLAAGVLAHCWEDRTDEREKSDAFLKLLFRSKHLEFDREIVRRVEELAAKRGSSMAIIAIAWIISKGGMAPICGLYNKQQVDDSVKALNAQLTEQESKYLEEAYVPKSVMGY